VEIFWGGGHRLLLLLIDVQGRRTCENVLPVELANMEDTTIPPVVENILVATRENNVQDY
jgi:hypothetical protein